MHAQAHAKDPVIYKIDNLFVLRRKLLNAIFDLKMKMAKKNCSKIKLLCTGI
jgi:hypothetical protein